MAGSLNKVQLIGNLGADVEVRTTQSGKKIANLRVATSERWRDKTSGERREKTEWHTVCVFSEGLVRVCEQHLRKGSKVYIEGQLQTRKWQDQQGNDRYSTEVVLQGFDSKLIMLDGKPQDQGAGYGGNYQEPPAQGGGAPAGGHNDPLGGSEIPFAPIWWA